MKKEHQYIAIDLKSFYASVECVERGLDPLTTNLVVADKSRTEKTICLAVSPSLKAYGISGRPRLFEVIQIVKKINNERKMKAPNKVLEGSSFSDFELKNNSSLALDFIAATPRMAHYMKYSARIYEIYLKYIAKEDIHVYSIDEVFMDVTNYLKLYKLSAHDLAKKIIQDVLKETGITATAGIGTNLYLAKVAMDIGAKHTKADKDGVRIAELNEMSYRKLLWSHTPLTDFWRVGRGYKNKLEAHGMFTMGDIARVSLKNEDLLYELFGINAELLIDHAWGYEPCTIKDIKAYKPENNSVSSGQVLQEAYTYEKARLVVKEMTDSLVLDLVEKDLVTDQMVLTIGYDIECITNPKINQYIKDPITKDYYGRTIPKPAHGIIHLKRPTSSTRLITSAVMDLYKKIMNPKLLVKRIYVVACNVQKESQIKEQKYEQLDIFMDYETLKKKQEEEKKELDKEKKLQKTILSIKGKYGKNAVIKGMDLEEGATTIDRNKQIGGHKA
ncbi:MAG: DNA methylase [Erysipelotrichales bacterium]|nr:DNA methylase [Erysipelotrichales bacterium]